MPLCYDGIQLSLGILYTLDPKKQRKMWITEKKKRKNTYFSSPMIPVLVELSFASVSESEKVKKRHDSVFSREYCVYEFVGSQCYRFIDTLLPVFFCITTYARELSSWIRGRSTLLPDQGRFFHFKNDFLPSFFQKCMTL